MTGRRVCWAVVAILATTACGASTAGAPGPSTVTVPAVVELGPLPTQPTTSARAETPSTVAPTAAPTTARPNSIPASTSILSATSIPSVASAAATSTPATRRASPNETTCTDVAYIGDSVSLGMVSAATPQSPNARFASQMSAIGVADLQVDVSGGRSIVETLPGQENAVTAAKRLRDAGFVGCWVIAVGTNDAANIAAGAARQADERIAAVMSVVGRDPVVWVDAASTATSGFWATPNIDAWNRVLTAAAASYPNMRIAPWSSFVRPEWFESDGVHVTAAGAAGRTHFVTDSLVAAFPLR